MKVFNSLEAYDQHCQKEKLKEIISSPEVTAITQENIPVEEKIEKLEKHIEEKMSPKKWQPE